jgi:hypothetical protein
MLSPNQDYFFLAGGGVLVILFFVIFLRPSLPMFILLIFSSRPALLAHPTVADNSALS